MGATLVERARTGRRIRYAKRLAAVAVADFGVSKSAVEDGGAADRRGAGARPFRKILGQFAVPNAGRFSDRALRRHPLFDRAPPVITIVRFHVSPPLRGIRASPANG